MQAGKTTYNVTVTASPQMEIFSVDAEKASNKTQYIWFKKKAEELEMVGHSLSNKSYLPKISANITLTLVKL